MKFLLSILLCLLSLQCLAHEAHTVGSNNNLAISLVFDDHGYLWRARYSDGFIFVDKSKDKGKTFEAKVQVNKTKQNIAAKGEARPKIAIGPQGNVYLTWTQSLAKRFTGYIWFARSVDGGKTFEQPIIVHQDRAEITHRFDALHVAKDGLITVSWVDKRDLEAAKAAGKAYAGAAIYYAISKDNGASFNREQKLAEHSCECCRIATTEKPDGTVVALWRHVFEGSERDHMIAEIPKAGNAVEPHRASFGHWKIDGCPHHGGTLATGGDGEKWWGYHMAYFDGKDNKPGLYYSRMDGVAWAVSPAKRFGKNAKQARHPSMVSIHDKVWIVWLETHANNRKHVMGMASFDDGQTWTAAAKLLEINGKSDYPQLIKFKDKAYLVVNTSDGLKIKAL